MGKAYIALKIFSCLIFAPVGNGRPHPHQYLCPAFSILKKICIKTAESGNSTHKHTPQLNTIRSSADMKAALFLLYQYITSVPFCYWSITPRRRAAGTSSLRGVGSACVHPCPSAFSPADVKWPLISCIPQPDKPTVHCSLMVWKSPATVSALQLMAKWWPSSHEMITLRFIDCVLRDFQI